MSVIAYYLGKIKFNDAYNLQKKIVQLSLDISAYRKLNTILLLEHDPVYTIGIRNNDKNTDYSKSYINKLTDLGADFVKTDRGGLITFHGPGQLVAYPILNLKSPNFKNSIKWYVETLEHTIIGTCGAFGLQTQRTNDVGIWTSDFKKVASIGIHKRQSVTYHGMALNCMNDLSWFDMIVPCGLIGRRATSLSRELGKEISVVDAAEQFIKCFEEHFSCAVQLAEINCLHF